MEVVVSLGQMDIALGEPDVNLEKVRGLAAEASHRGSEVLVLPELWSTGCDLEDVGKHATATDEGIFAETAQLAQEHSLYIVGSLLSAEEKCYFNRATIFSPSRQLLAKYDKIHLFSPMGEDKYRTPGRTAQVFDAPWGKSALAICYDLCFPGLFREYALAGPKVVFLPAEWPKTHLSLWRRLLRARAIENQCFIIGCNGLGECKGMSFGGHSAIFGPWGELVVEGGQQEMILTAEIDSSLVDDVRRRFPFLA